MLRRHFVVGTIGARQVGKSTLAKMLARGRRGPVTFFDLENDEDLARLSDPLRALKGLRGLVVIDEIQHRSAGLEMRCPVPGTWGRPSTYTCRSRKLPLRCSLLRYRAAAAPTWCRYK